MDYYVINTMPIEDDDLCFLATPPIGIELLEHRLSKGDPMGPDYPDGVRMFMDDRHRGVVLPDVVGNSRSLLLVSKRVKEVFERLHDAPTEYLSVTIMNHEKRKASADYFIVNPLGTFDCLDLGRSDLQDGELMDIDAMVGDPKKLEKAPHLFRVKEAPRTYVLSAELCQALVEVQPTPTNIYIEPLQT